MRKLFLVVIVLATVVGLDASCIPCNNPDNWAAWGPYENCIAVKGDECNKTETRIRKYEDVFACTDCNRMYESRTCGKCSQKCHKTNGCFCESGFKLLSDGVSCEDINECNSSPNICEQTCENTEGSYNCSCSVAGYEKKESSQTSPSCKRKQCGILTRDCPSNSYTDRAGSACKEVSKICSSKDKFESNCSLSCQAGFALAYISHNGDTFAEYVKDADFNVTFKQASCILGTNNVYWDVKNPNNLFCRRINDAPRNLSLSSNTVKENMPSGTVIGKVKANDDIGQKLTFTVEMSQGDNLFFIEDDVLKTRRIFNLRTLSSNLISIKIRATDDHHTTPMFSEKVFSIVVENVNDAPEDIVLSNTIFSDLYQIGDVIGNLSAIDYDEIPATRKSSEFDWSLLDDNNGYFSLIGYSLVLAKKFTQNQNFTFTIVVKCTDRDTTSPKSSEKQFVLTIQDINSPVKLHLDIRNPNIAENATKGTIYGHLRAVDSENNTITLKDILEISTKSMFTIKNFTCNHEVSGTVCGADIVLVGQLDYEAKKTYTMTIGAVDSHNEHVTKSFTINVQNVNEAPTSVQISTERQLEEDSSEGVLVATLKTDDPEGEKLNCDVVKDNSAISPFEVRGHNVVLKGNSVVNFELKNIYNLKIRCWDGGNPRLEVINETKIYVQDKNEVPGSPCPISKKIISQTTPVGAKIIDLRSRDPDNEVMLKQRLTYVMFEGENSVFEIINGSKLTVKKVLRPGTTYNVKIAVQDDGTLQKHMSGGLVKYIDTFKRKVYTCEISTDGVSIPCQSYEEYRDGKCRCKDKLSGFMCDRNGTRCEVVRCASAQICSQFVQSPAICVSIEYQISMLLDIKFNKLLDEEYRYDLENYVRDVLSGNAQGKSLKNLKGNQSVRRKRRTTVPQRAELYIEGINPNNIRDIYTYITFVAYNTSDQMSMVHASKLCKLFDGTDLSCVNEKDCNIIKGAGKSCENIAGGNVGSPPTEKKGGTPNYVYIVLAIVVILIIISVVFMLLKRRRCKGAETKNAISITYNNDARDQTMADIEEHRRRTDINHFDSKVFSNDSISKDKFEFQNPSYNLTVNFRANHSYIDEEKGTSNENKSKQNNIYASIGKSATNPLYQPSIKRSSNTTDENMKGDIIELPKENVKAHGYEDPDNLPDLKAIRSNEGLNVYNAISEKENNKTFKKDKVTPNGRSGGNIYE